MAHEIWKRLIFESMSEVLATKICLSCSSFPVYRVLLRKGKIRSACRYFQVSLAEESFHFASLSSVPRNAATGNDFFLKNYKILKLHVQTSRIS